MTIFDGNASSSILVLHDEFRISEVGFWGWELGTDSPFICSAFKVDFLYARKVNGKKLGFNLNC